MVSSIAYISSLKKPYGTVQQMIDTAPARNRTVYVWCYKDVSEPCPDERSGTEPTIAYVDKETLDAVSAERPRARTSRRSS